jgi:hypothetical protein
MEMDVNLVFFFFQFFVFCACHRIVLSASFRITDV